MSEFITKMERQKKYVFVSTIMVTFVLLNVIVNHTTNEISDLKIVTGTKQVKLDRLSLGNHKKVTYFYS